MDIRDGERLDEIGFGGLKLIQKPQDFCYGVDAVLLADFAASIAKKKISNHRSRHRYGHNSGHTQSQDLRRENMRS